MRKLILITLVLFNFPVTALSSEGLSLEIAELREREKYRAPIAVSIKNVSKKNIIVPLVLTCGGFYLEFKIWDEVGNEIQFTGTEYDFIESEKDYLRMPPNSIFSQIIDLSKCYSIPIGKVTVQATYSIEPGIRREKFIWFGSLSSNQVIFEFFD